MLSCTPAEGDIDLTSHRTPREQQPPESLEEALAKLERVIGSIVHTAEEKSRQRCPYMNTLRECTAGFECINQVARAAHERPLCSGQHKINFEKLG